MNTRTLLVCLSCTGMLASATSYANHYEVAQIAAGANHACARLENGHVKCWGGNDHGQLGLGDDDDRGDEPGEMGNDLPFVELGSTNIAHIALGSDHGCAVHANGAIKCWGSNAHGQLGLGDTENRGDDPGEMGTALPTIDLGLGRTADNVVAGDEHTCALLDNGTVKCWGSNTQGQLGLGNTNNRGDAAGEMGDQLPTVNLGIGRTAVQITAGYAHTCALLDDDTIKCWGGNSYGQLGLGSTTNRGDNALEMGMFLPIVSLGPTSTPLRIVSGNDHNCVLFADGTVKCWGRNSYSQLGAGHTNNVGDGPFEMGIALASVPLNPDFAPITQLQAGSFHTCVIDGGELFCWGHNIVGQLGLGDRDDRGDSISDMSDDLPPVHLGHERNAVQVAGGWIFTCARLGNERVKCWGMNAYGQLGLGDEETRGNDPGEMGPSLPFVDLGGDGCEGQP